MRWGRCWSFEGENPFRCRAYHAAAQATVELARRSVGDDWQRQSAQGSGDRRHHAREDRAARHDRPFAVLRRATADDAAGLGGALRIPGLGPKKIKALHEELKIESLADLRHAAESGQIAPIKGFGAKTEAKILEGIAFIEKAGERILQSDAIRLVGADPGGCAGPSSG